MDELTQEFIAESREGLERMELCLTELEQHPADSELVSEIFRTVHTIKGTTSFLGFTRLQTLAHTGESLLGAVRDGRIAVTSRLITSLLALLDGLREILCLIERSGSEGQRSTDDDKQLIASLNSQGTGGREPPEVASHSPDQPDTGLATGRTIQEHTLRIDVEVLNRMMNLVGELILTRNQIVQYSASFPHFSELARRLNNVTGELRECVRQARMEPVGRVFGQFPRMVRDLAITCGRQVRVEFEGQETGLDKSLLEAIRGPLTHAVRNAVDHGIEPPEARLLAGKPAEGLLRLRAFHQNGSVVVEVIDDGGGISTERVTANAVERGLVSQEQAASMSSHDIFQLLFLPGFSTVQEVTSVSGRGVGLDVVNSHVKKVGGSAEIESRVGLGTTLRLRVPLTLAIVPALVVHAGARSFALPQGALVELVYVPQRDSASAVEWVGAAPVYRLRESLLPLVWLERLLHLDRSAGDDPRSLYIAVLESEGLRFGLVVDGLAVPEEIVVKPLSAMLRDIGVYSGATMLGNGLLALILDVQALAQKAGVRSVDENISSARNSDASSTEHSTTKYPLVEPAQPCTTGPMVVYEVANHGVGPTGHAGPIAVPFGAVERIVRVPLNTIEYGGGKAMVQFDGEFLPLEDCGQLLIELEAASAAAVTVLICRRPGTSASHRMGIVVGRVLDVSSGTLLPAGAAMCPARLAVVNDRVTTVHTEFADETALQEVA